MKAISKLNNLKPVISMTAAIARKVGCVQAESENIQFSAHSGKLVISGFNDIMRVDTIISADVVAEGHITGGMKILVDIVDAMDGDVTVATDGNKLLATDGKTVARIKAGEADKYPEAKSLPKVAPTASVKGADFIAMMKSLIPLAQEDLSRPQLHGVNINFKDDKFTLKSGDGFVVGIGNGNLIEGCTEAVSFTIPTEAAEVLCQYANGDDVYIYHTKSTSWFVFWNTVLTVENVYEPFPAIESLFPNGINYTISFGYDSVMEFAKKADKIVPAPDSGTKSIKFAVSGDKLNLSCIVGDTSFESPYKGECTTSGEPVNFRLAIFNLKKLHKVFKKSTLKIDIEKAHRPMVATSEVVRNLKVLVMPVAIASEK